MSPDGKHLRVAASNWGAILEIDPHGNWEVVIDGSDGVMPQGTWNSIAYDREGNFYVSGRGNVKVMKFPADGSLPEPLAYYNNNGVILSDAYGLSVGPSGEVYVAGGSKLIRIGEDGVVSLFDQLPFFIYSVLVDDFGYVHVQMGGYWYRYSLGDPSSSTLFSSCSGIGPPTCSSQALELSPDRTRIYTGSYDDSTHLFSMISVDPRDGSFETVIRNGGELDFTVVPLRGDVNGDGDTDLADMTNFVTCMQGPGESVVPSCDLADMDADSDVDLFDFRWFMLAYSAFGK